MFGAIWITAFALSATPNAAVDFDTEIVPILSKAGCNAAACHGGAAGQAGFRLSLFGGDPELDYRSIVRDLEGRRINFGQPRDSLLIAKPTEQLEHGGGQVIDYEGRAAHTLVDWIAAGASRLRKRDLESIQITPAESLLDSVPAEVALKVVAKFNDGESRDVTDLAVYVSRNEAALELSAGGKMRVIRAGRHSASVRFGNQVQTVSVTSPLGRDRPTRRPSSNWPPSSNWIDDEIDEVLRVLWLTPASQSDDAAFLRRVCLDLTGRLPTVNATKSFLRNAAKNKRTALIDELLASAAFTEYYTHRLAGLLRIRPPATDQTAAKAFYGWLRNHVSHDAGWNEMAVELLLSEGDTHTDGAATFHRLFATAREQAEYVSEVLMGVRLRCANCHNHPLDRWTQDDYHGLAQIFAGVQRGRVVEFSDRGEVKHPRTGMAAVARIPGNEFIDDDGDHRRALADWLTHRDNPYFARAMVGRIWEWLMGRGLVSPIDDLRATNPASHPRLFDRLAEYFIEQDYRLRPLIKLICNSNAYAKSSQPPPDAPPDDRFYSYGLRKSLSAEVLADAISDVTLVGDEFGNAGSSRAIAVVDRSQASATLRFLGQCIPNDGCQADAAVNRGIASKLHLMNGPLLNRKIQDSKGRLQQLLHVMATTEEIVTEFYLRALCREPSQTELTQWKIQIDGMENTGTRSERCEDFVWALLNCHEFTTNH